MKLKLLSIATLVFIGLITSGCGEKDKKEQTNKQANRKIEKIEEPSITYTLKENNNSIIVKPVDNGFEFNVNEPIVLLDFFATWCPPCRAEIPHLVNLQKKYVGKLKIIGVLVENKYQREVNQFNERYGINYFISNSSDNINFAAITADMLHQPRNFSIPMMVLFINGKYFRHYIGMVPEEMLESDIKEAIKEIKSVKKK